MFYYTSTIIYEPVQVQKMLILMNYLVSQGTLPFLRKHVEYEVEIVKIRASVKLNSAVLIDIPSKPAARLFCRPEIAYSTYNDKLCGCYLSPYTIRNQRLSYQHFWKAY